MTLSVEDWFVLYLIITALPALGEGSKGDQSFVFFNCNRTCLRENCHMGSKFTDRSSLQLVKWNCQEECYYQCMWTAVEAFQKDGTPIPQFFGKWPFIRLFGIQEPASTCFSILNGLSHLMIFRYRSFVRSTTPLYYVWHGLALLAGHAWFWSTIFHSKDTPFTERMDYFCAFSIILYNVFILCCRVFGTDKWWKPLCLGLLLLIVFVQHIFYMAWIKFDYGYNMKVNVVIGLINLLGWVAWCFCNRDKTYIWKCGVSVLSINLLLTLELLDFPPLWWIFDAHSLWHAGTAPLALLWYSFVIDDGLYLMSNTKDKKAKKTV
ncbi:hypothetical protein CHS0354_023211 [Potamilus streckersoni]|uniref:Post-GPI attachment to proteins factor 3 n=1 Tax=Potamilus streckersoni TaxID=2493646 RepID=A0AAE0SJ78_9BIVA|nr:hypothetical protein CHS0354_023211 [Potamilus streckersoni]